MPRPRQRYLKQVNFAVLSAESLTIRRRDPGIGSTGDGAAYRSRLLQELAGPGRRCGFAGVFWGQGVG
jgi:hypothetical protein